MHLVNIQCDNAPERALHLTGEEELVLIYTQGEVRAIQNHDFGNVKP